MKPQHKDIGKFAKTLAEAERLDWYSVKSLIEVLEVADDMYFNGDGESFINDKTYDTIRRHVEIIDPSHVYFTGIGSDVRGGKVKLPYPLGSLDQVYEGEICDWVGNWGLQQHNIILTEKLDGQAAMIVYDANGDLQIAYSRGNGTEGADWTRHIKNFKCVPSNVGGPMVVRGEVIFTKEAWKKVKSEVKSHGGRAYKNSRNMTAGLMNRKRIDSHPSLIFNNIHFVAYEILGSDHDKVNMLADLRDAGFLTPHWSAWEGMNLTDVSLTQHLETRKARTEYEIDGLVLDVDSSMKRSEMNPSRDTLNPAFAVKYKVADADNIAIATVVNVEWNASKHGYLKPRVEIKPVELVGVTITHATGFNARFIVDNDIGPGARVQITRSGDVIPFIQKVIEGALGGPSYPQFQGEHKNFNWNETGVDLVLDNHHEHDDVIVNQLIDFFSSIDAPCLKKGNVQKMYDSGIDTVEAFILAPQDDFTDVLGKNGKKAWEGLSNKLNGIPLYKLMGALPYFGRGVGVRKFKKLQKAIGAEPLLCLGGYRCREEDLDKICAVDEFEYKTAKKILAGMREFNDFMEYVEEWVTVDYGDEDTSGGSLNGEKIVFTGFRDKPLQEIVESQGGTMQSGISGKTTILVAKNPTSTSGKMKKARDLGVRIMGVDEFKEQYV